MTSPMRRPRARTYNDMHRDDDGSIWTATRCHRLLRLLTSRIATIRKHRERYQRKEDATNPEQNISQDIRATFTSVNYSNDQERQDDPDWAPPRPSKRPRHTYSTRGVPASQQRQLGRSRAGTDEGPRTVARETVMSTPRIPLSKTFISLSSADGDSPGSRWRAGDRAPGPGKARSKFSAFRSHQIIQGIDQHVWDGVEAGLGTLLNTTRILPAPGARRGTKTLFTTCLAQVPKHILDEQKISDDDSDHDAEDYAITVYADLESLGTNPSEGWRPLRQVVRVHGVEILAEAIRDNLVPSHIGLRWVEQCDRHLYNEGAEIILNALVQVCLEEGNNSDNTLESIIHYCSSPGPGNYHKRSLWRFLKEALLCGRKSLSWIMNPARVNVWGDSASAIVLPDERGEKSSAMSFINQLFECALSTRPTGAEALVHRLRLRSQQRPSTRYPRPVPMHAPMQVERPTDLSEMPWLFMAILDVLMTVFLLGSDQESLVLASFRCILDHVCLVLDCAPPTKITEFQTTILAMLQLANTIVHASDQIGKYSTPQLDGMVCFQQGRIKGRILDALSRLMSFTAERCEGMGGASPTSVMESISRTLLDVARRPDARGFASVAVSAALDLAERHPIKSVIVMAEEIELEADELVTNVKDTRHPSSDSGAIDVRPSFRWEDSISEWVMKTPKTQSRPQTARKVSRPSSRLSRDVSSRSEVSNAPRRQQSAPIDTCHDSDDESEYGARPLAASFIRSTDHGWQSDSDSDRSATSTRRSSSSESAERDGSPDTITDFSLTGSDIDEASYQAVQPRVLVPPVSAALKRSVSVGQCRASSPARKKRVTRHSDNGTISLYRRDGKRVGRQRLSKRLRQANGKSEPSDDSEDELGI